MAKRPKRTTFVAAQTPAHLHGRVQRAVAEGRYQNALELARQLVKAEPTPAHEALLREVIIGRARQLRQQGATRDARTMLEQVIPPAGGDPAWLQQLAEELAAVGGGQRALELLKRLPDSPARGQVLGHAVDGALCQGPAGRNSLPADLQPGFDLVLRAFDQLAAGQDAAARETLQPIGLQSPFLEWKVFLRGLQAFYQRDDARALENWSRLKADRFPARLAAPFRFRLDSAFRQAQSPEAQLFLQKQADALFDPGLVPMLRHVQAAMSREDLLPAFRQAEAVLPALRKESSTLVDRLAHCFYWEIINGGHPEDMARFRRVFGPPADDPDFSRLEALVMERLGDREQAHEHWQKFEKQVAAHPQAWAGHANRVRALVWQHMGQNAAAMPDETELAKLPPFLRDHPRRPRPLTPSAEACFQKALALAPEQLETYESLFNHFQKKRAPAKARQAAQQLLNRFPDHLPTLVALGDLCMAQQESEEALRLYQRALKTNPLDRRLRGKVSTAHIYHARSMAEAGQFDAARAEYQAALAHHDQPNNPNILCKWAACEFKAGNASQAEELLQKALTQQEGRLAVAFSMLIEVIRLKLDRKLKARFDQDFTAGLAAPPTGAAASEIAAVAAAHQMAGLKYYGQKTHEKKVLTYLEKAIKADFTEEQLERTIGALLGMKATKLLQKYTTLGSRKHPRNPIFPFMEAESLITKGRRSAAPWRVGPLLEKARQLTEALPRDSRHRDLLEAIQKRQEEVGMSNPFFGAGGMGIFEDLMNNMFDEEDLY